MSFETRWASGVRTLAATAVRSRLLERYDTPRQLLDDTAFDPDIREAFSAPGASFVTLTKDGRLRGCIGNLVADRPLSTALVHHARRATTDPRMAAVTVDEWPHLTIEVSILSQPRPIDVDTPADLLASLRPDVDGLTLRQGSKRATFLPSVWKTLKSPERFVAGLLAKGGWDEWPTDIQIERYTTETYTDHPPRPQLEPT